MTFYRLILLLPVGLFLAPNIGVYALLLPLPYLLCARLSARDRTPIVGGTLNRVLFVFGATAFVAVSMSDQLLQYPNIFPNHITSIYFKNTPFLTTFVEPVLLGADGKTYAFVYYYGLSALYGTFARFLSLWFSLEVAMFTATYVAFFGMLIVGFHALSATLPFRGHPVRPLAVLFIVLYLPGVELFWFYAFSDVTGFEYWPYWWAGFEVISQSSPIDQFVWVPQQAALIPLQLALWLTNGDHIARSFNRALVLMSSLACGPFLTIGWILLFMWEAPAYLTRWRRSWVQYLCIFAPAAGFACYCATIFLSKQFPEGISFTYPQLGLLGLIEFLIVENLVYAVLVLAVWRELPWTQSARIGYLFACLLVLSFFKIGYYNDLWLRFSTPLILVILLPAVVRTLEKPKLAGVLIAYAAIFGLAVNLHAYYYEFGDRQVNRTSLRIVPDRPVSIAFPWTQYLGPER